MRKYLLLLSVALLTVPAFSQTSAKKPLKIFIAVDSEGPSGVVTYWGHDYEHGLYAEGQQLLMSDVNAAVEGCQRAGATEIVVSDDTAKSLTISPLTLNPAALLIRGRAREKRLPNLHGLDETFSGVILLGTHAREGTPDGVLAHTLSGVSEEHRRYWHNGREIGEMDVYATVAGHYGVPVIMVTGCEATCRQARELLGDQIVTVAVKKAFAQERAVVISPKVTAGMITRGVQEAVARMGKIPPYRVPVPVKVRLQFPTKELADRHEANRRKRYPDWPGVRVDERTFEAVIHSLLDPNLYL
ncbi:MAG: M55 family metallopeptidase [Bryobacteraceae bacterium]